MRWAWEKITGSSNHQPPLDFSELALIFVLGVAIGFIAIGTMR